MQTEADTRSHEETQMRITELQEFIGSQWPNITEFDDFLSESLSSKSPVTMTSSPWN